MIESMTVEYRDHLKAVRSRLLDLHKLLLDRQRDEYERSHAKIASPGDYLSLVLNAPEFEWLRHLSGLIVQFDEVLSPRAKLGESEAESALAELRALLRPSPDGIEFQRRLDAAIQESPDVVIEQCRLEKLLGI